ncbi:MAG: cob(I)yrinic acid a,c-diamide adenosyltransferase [Candidatus Sumerlaeales bacterium]|nr:cob(I)yrinic acid a,c-diamide adenosyltransferase [Candidatus Sumerlaeales bacterium]
MNMNAKNPLLVVLTGSGKGKTTTSLGMAVRALGAGLRVGYVCFDKGISQIDDSTDGEFYSERVILRQLSDVDLFTFGRCRVTSEGSFDFANTDEDIAQAQQALSTSRTLIESGQYGMVVCDEILTCGCASQLITRKEVLGLVDVYTQHGRPCHLVMTGRGAENWKQLIDRADIVTEMRCVKHCYENGVDAQKGLDY